MHHAAYARNIDTTRPSTSTRMCVRPGGVDLDLGDLLREVSFHFVCQEFATFALNVEHPILRITGHRTHLVTDVLFGKRGCDHRIDQHVNLKQFRNQIMAKF